MKGYKKKSNKSAETHPVRLGPLPQGSGTISRGLETFCVSETHMEGLIAVR